jgi:hypothetical protein
VAVRGRSSPIDRSVDRTGTRSTGLTGGGLVE